MHEKICPSCGSKYPENMKFCEKCGIPLDGVSENKYKFCQTCGIKLKDDAKFCERCGALQEPITNNIENKNEIKDETKNNIEIPKQPLENSQNNDIDENSKLCPKCNAKLPKESNFCPVCMTKFVEETVFEPPKKKSKIPFYIIGGVALVCVGVGVGILVSKLAVNTPAIQTSDVVSSVSENTVVGSSLAESSLTSSEISEQESLEQESSEQESFYQESSYEESSEIEISQQESSQEESVASSQDIDYSQYIGEWYPTVESGYDKTVKITYVSGNKIIFDVFVGNMQRVITARDIMATMDGNTGTFTFVDSWLSKGHGTIVFEEDGTMVINTECDEIGEPGGYYLYLNNEVFIK